VADPLNHPAVGRVSATLQELGATGIPRALDQSARTAAEAAAALGVEVGQIASSIVFALPLGEGQLEALPLLVVTSGRHRVDTKLVAAGLKVEKLERADADFVRRWSSFAIGGVPPVGWQEQLDGVKTPIQAGAKLTVLVDQALNDYDVVWAAAGHPHVVFPTTYDELVQITGGHPATITPW
jgi:prolyl-tRNA editing enzyme YbaK/EbsC (Cys-tRNA(Pro) deacylase)